MNYTHNSYENSLRAAQRIFQRFEEWEAPDSKKWSPLCESKLYTHYGKENARSFRCALIGKIQEEILNARVDEEREWRGKVEQLESEIRTLRIERNRAARGLRSSRND